MLVVDKALVMQKVKYGETSIISTLLTQNHGVISCITKGAFNPRKNLSNLLQIGNILEISLELKPLKNLHFLQSINLYNACFDGHISPLRQSVVIYMMEFLHKILKTDENQKLIFNHTEIILKNINDFDKKQLLKIPIIYTLELIQNLGFSVDMWLISDSDLHDFVWQGWAKMITNDDFLVSRHAYLLEDLLKYIQNFCLPISDINSIKILREILA